MYLTCQNTCKKLIKAVQENRTVAAGINASDSLCLVQVKAPHDATLVGDKVQNKFCSTNRIPKNLLCIKRYFMFNMFEFCVSKHNVGVFKRINNALLKIK